ncbi:MAG: succinyl-diaminopimelate desuccinylase, partial [Alphaproteobacteria bacterium]|nr:succinyl-diaminopimelate desuccinylase [Alphaproteobacteria bacterium]
LWTYPPFSATVADGYLWGRGACDMKSSLAAMVAAVARHKQTYGKNPPLAFAATSDEEGIAINGTAKLLPHLAARGHTFGFCINGEPTSNRVVGDTVKVGRRGSFSATLHVQGRQGHVAYPQLAQNPVPVLLNLLQALRHLPLDKPFAQFPPTHLEITSIDVGNPARNVIPATASANVNIRYNPAYTHDELTEMIQAMLARIADKNIFSLHVVTPPTPAFITQNTPLLEKMIATIARTAGVTPALSTDGGTSDARFIQAFCPVIDCGPTNATIHQTNERIALTDLEKITEIYAAMIDVFTRH